MRKPDLPGGTLGGCLYQLQEGGTGLLAPSLPDVQIRTPQASQRLGVLLINFKDTGCCFSLRSGFILKVFGAGGKRAPRWKVSGVFPFLFLRAIRLLKHPSVLVKLHPSFSTCWVVSATQSRKCSV